ncbi:MAG: hypothetical protein H6626_10790 [Pseudobdellovibrionaceae bacterium]|mgnify:CR=1 FL=1|nr:hypothetical protein [Bdellovibrionales bacterium]USN46691.1 MAG: hypothetical protein H6626_10790 [Pseudobdellovibrionaceae bacterium]
MNSSVIVVDNFYSDPDCVRELALGDELVDPFSLSGNFAGRESEYNYFSESIVESFEKILGTKIVVDEDSNAFGRFRFARASDKRKTQIHFDNKDWSAVVYLSRNSPSGTGTIFVEHRRLNLVGPPVSKEELQRYGCDNLNDFDRKYVLPDTLNPGAWATHLRVPFKYNRLVLFRGRKLFHGSEGLFGENRADGRLTHNFFFDEAR